MKEYCVFEDGEKTSPTKRLETVYLPRKPLPDDIATLEKKAPSQTAMQTEAPKK